ncbi:MAG: hypothetical protein HYW77_02070 [Parcubacteria group bacterium]|nr:hypothetical protein [Parcubacteria group bacterium]
MSIQNPQKDVFIGFDLDGVLINHTKIKIFLAAKRNIKLLPRQTQSEILKSVISAPVLEKIQYELYDHPKTSILSPLMPGAKMILNKLKKKKIKFALISRRKNQEGAIRLMKLRGLWPTFFNEKNSFFVTEATEKNTQAKLLGITHFIDDEKHILGHLNQVKNKFLFDRLNVFKNDDRYFRILSWQNFNEYLSKNKII